eukprot:m.257506 g.257506  ORF g.257506 m.257506 type:complete len:233 (+) comp15958_c0_seq16:2175-2873(+)
MTDHLCMRTCTPGAMRSHEKKGWNWRGVQLNLRIAIVLGVALGAAAVEAATLPAPRPSSEAPTTDTPLHATSTGINTDESPPVNLGGSTPHNARASTVATFVTPRHNTLVHSDTAVTGSTMSPSSALNPIPPAPSPTDPPPATAASATVKHAADTSHAAAQSGSGSGMGGMGGGGSGAATTTVAPASNPDTAVPLWATTVCAVIVLFVIIAAAMGIVCRKQIETGYALVREE